MCALFGWLDYKGIVPHWILKKLTQLLANAAEERGTDAAGIAYVRNGHMTIFKRPKPAHQIHFKVPNKVKAVMGHTRFATQGDEHQNYNNHPFYGKAGKSFSLAHNGVLYNDSALRFEHNLPETRIETDSYVAVQLIESQKELDFPALQYMAENVMGNFTFTVLDEDQMLWFIKGSNPLYLIHFPELGLYVYASTESIMKTALHHTAFHWMHFEVIKIEEGEILRINSNGKITRGQFQPSFANLFTGYRRKTVDDSLSLLMDMCGYFGMSEDEIQYLYEMGYSYDEIEEFMLNPAALNEEYFCSER